MGLNLSFGFTFRNAAASEYSAKENRSKDRKMNSRRLKEPRGAEKSFTFIRTELALLCLWFLCHFQLLYFLNLNIFSHLFRAVQLKKTFA
jgi:hypothetical protein